MVVGLLDLRLGHDLGHVVDQAFEFVVLLLDDVVEVHGFTLALDAALLGTHLVPQALSLFHRQAFFFSRFQLFLQISYPLLSLQEVEFILLPLAATSLLISLVHLIVRFDLVLDYPFFFYDFKFFRLFLHSFIQKLAFVSEKLRINDGLLFELHQTVFVENVAELVVENWGSCGFCLAIEL